MLSEVFGETEPVLQLVTGLGATGAELAKSGVGKIAFTGSAATARKVLAAAAESLTPVLAESGGKDALLADADADLDAAADAVACRRVPARAVSTPVGRRPAPAGA